MRVDDVASNKCQALSGGGDSGGSQQSSRIIGWDEP
jgi:hypothetical protein